MIRWALASCLVGEVEQTSGVASLHSCDRPTHVGTASCHHSARWGCATQSEKHSRNQLEGRRDGTEKGIQRDVSIQCLVEACGQLTGSGLCRSLQNKHPATRVTASAATTPMTMPACPHAQHPVSYHEVCCSTLCLPASAGPAVHEPMLFNACKYSQSPCTKRL